MSDSTIVDTEVLRDQVREKYRAVAVEPDATYHFHTGRSHARRLGYDETIVASLPDRAVESFAGIGNPFSLRALERAERVVDVGSGAGFDSFVAAHQVGHDGAVIGVDMTAEMLDKATATTELLALAHVEFRNGYAEQLPVEDGWADVVISNGVINLSPDKAAVFREAARLLRPGGRLALADIVTNVQLPETVTCDATLWAACIGGAMQRDAFVEAIEQAGFTVTTMKANHEYRFLSRSAQNATRRYGVHSLSLLAIRN
jgi:ubiquinone/menaquinone biosynthesis C-methylase UbiE